MRKKLGANAHPIFLPIGAEDNFKGIIDLVEQKAILYTDDDAMGSKPEITDIPEEFKEQAADYRENLIEAVADYDDDVATKYLEGEEITDDEFKLAIRKATLSLGFVV